MLQKGDKAPDFTLMSDEGKNVSLKDFSGKRLVLYFYPKDDTPGCTIEANDFTALAEQFGEINTVIAGVSPDSAERHVKFKNKYNLKIVLLADTEKQVCAAYDVWREKNMYGRKSMGVLRSTFVISPEGIIEEALYNVKAKGHAESLLCTLKK